MVKHIKFITFCLLIFNVFLCQADDKKLNLLLLKPLGGDIMPFWLRLSDFSQVVANDLKINLDVHTTPYEFQEQDKTLGLLELLLSKKHYHGIIFTMPHDSYDQNFLNQIGKYNIPFISINTGLSKKMLDKVGKPRHKYKHWLAHISPDDISAGARLASVLSSRIKIGVKAKLFALSGTLYTIANDERVFGLKNARAYSNKFEFTKLVHTNWLTQDAKEKMSQAIKNNDIKNINLLWTAGDLIAQGAIQAMEEHNIKPGQDILVGSFDWNDESINLIEKGKLEASLGGHFIEAGLATILLHDYLKGRDFSNDTGTIIKTQLQALSRQNLPQIKAKLRPKYWKTLDYSRQSKYFNKRLEHYKTSPKELLHIN